MKYISRIGRHLLMLSSCLFSSVSPSEKRKGKTKELTSARVELGPWVREVSDLTKNMAAELSRDMKLQNMNIVFIHTVLPRRQKGLFSALPLRFATTEANFFCFLVKYLLTVFCDNGSNPHPDNGHKRRRKCTCQKVVRVFFNLQVLTLYSEAASRLHIGTCLITVGNVLNILMGGAASTRMGAAFVKVELLPSVPVELTGRAPEQGTEIRVDDVAVLMGCPTKVRMGVFFSLRSEKESELS